MSYFDLNDEYESTDSISSTSTPITPSPPPTPTPNRTYNRPRRLSFRKPILTFLLTSALAPFTEADAATAVRVAYNRHPHGVDPVSVGGENDTRRGGGIGELRSVEEEEEEEEIDWNLRAPPPVPLERRRGIHEGRSSGAQAPSSAPGAAESVREPRPRRISPDEDSSDSSKPSNSAALPGGSEAVVVCGVDGTIYTLDAWTGQLRGLFASGGALVRSSTTDPPSPTTDSDSSEEWDDPPWDDDEDRDPGFQTQNSVPEGRVVPGLDGKLYYLTDTHLDVLPIDIQSVVDSPVSTCRRLPLQNDGVDEECGLVMGQRTTKTFAIDPATGTVRWVQSPDTSEGGFTAGQTTMHRHNDPTGFEGKGGGRKKVRTVLLQREDYVVRQVDIDSGDEFWSVGMGRFSALDFGTNGGGSGGGGEENEEKRYSTSIRPRVPSLPLRSTDTASTRTAAWAAVAKPIESNNPFLNDPPSSSPNDPFSAVRPTFPSIAFGQDGRSVLAVDHASGDLLWKRRIESVVASVYGVGSESQWVELDVLEEQDVVPENPCDSGGGGGEEDIVVPEDDDEEMEEGVEGEEAHCRFGEMLPYNQNAMLSTLPLMSYPSPTTTQNHISSTTTTTTTTYIQANGGSRAAQQLSTWLSPSSPGYKPCRGGSCDSTNAAKIGRHRSTLFVASTLKMPPSGKYDKIHLSLLYATNERDPVRIGEADTVSWPQYPAIGYQKHEAPKDETITNEDVQKTIQMAQEYIQTIKKSQSHHMQNGLFLTWSMVGLLVSCAVVGIVAGQIMYKKKKKKLADSTAVLPVHSGDGDRATPDRMSIGHGVPPMQLTLERSSRPSPPTRSRSLGALNSVSGDDSKSRHRFSLVGSTVLDKLSVPAIEGKDSAVEGKDKLLLGSNEGVNHVEGFPLLQYSRYSLEFQEISPLGKGGFGTVFKCCNTLDKREYAVKKVLIRSLVDSNGQLSKQFSLKLNRVLREVKILAVLDHPNIVRYYTAWLEVETNDDETTEEEESTIGILGTGTKNAAIGFSSNLLAGNDPSCQLPSASEYGQSSRRSFNHRNNRCSSTGRGRVDRLPSAAGRYKKPKENPLGVWNSFVADSSSSGWAEDSTVDRWQSHSMQGSGMHSIASEEDLGFNWDRDSAAPSTSATPSTGTAPSNGNFKSKSVTADGLATIQDKSASESKECSTIVMESESERKKVRRSTFGSTMDIESEYESKKVRRSTFGSAMDLHEKKESHTSSAVNLRNSHKHILYIQMQLSQKTLLDYFEDRIKTGKKSIDIADIVCSLKMFAHIARGLKHVHEKGLIHRDLKPSNCFMDDSEVKIGDFGLSRESNSDKDNVAHDDDKPEQKDDSLGDEDITTQVGTSSYASPEQMNGSNYNSSTDIFSLGIILFELIYPMYTGMERYKVLEGIRKQVFPPAWKAEVAKKFPSINKILTNMLSRIPKERPSASEVASHVESLLNEYTVLSLDHTTAREGSIFLRVEAQNEADILTRTMKIIQEAASNITILQYSLKGQDKGSIMEFALIITGKDDTEDKENEYNEVSDLIDAEEKEITRDQASDPIVDILTVLSNSSGINTARIVNERPSVRDINQQN